jgi:hypothetical protein
MDANWQPVQGSNPPAGVDLNAPAAGGDWRAQLQPEERSRIVNEMYGLQSIRFASLFPPSNHISSILPPFSGQFCRRSIYLALF